MKTPPTRRLALAALTLGVLVAPGEARADTAYFNSSMTVECSEFVGADPSASCTMLKFVLNIDGTPAIDTKVFSINMMNTNTAEWNFVNPSVDPTAVTVLDANLDPTDFTTSLLSWGFEVVMTSGTPVLEPLTIYAKVSGTGTMATLFDVPFQYDAQGTEAPTGPALFTTSGLATSTVPEPATLTFLATGLIGLLGVGVVRRRDEEEADS